MSSEGEGEILVVGKDHGAHSDHMMTKWPFQTALVLQDELSRELGEGQRTLNGKLGDLGLVPAPPAV